MPTADAATVSVGSKRKYATAFALPDAQHLVEEFIFHGDDSRACEAELADKHYHMEFDPDWLCPDAVHPTPQLDSIVRMEEWDSAEEELLLGMLGRLLFPDLMSNLSQTDLHNIINGERVEINIKYGGRRTLQWVAPFMLVANILLRCSKAYRRLAVRYKQDGTMPNILAKYYPRHAEVGSKVQQDNDPLVHFIDEFRKEFQNIVLAKDIKVYISMLEIAQSNRVKSGQSVPKSAFIENCSLNAFAIMDDEYQTL
ncbi:hypothetical protein T492DRAFT_885232 [Pavlovales sp. CCMP2436]|nr:hypothetical protein T492DRAFT_885232 [Pavlovales sp. CCMP2436]